ncbi:hypothetical protein [Actibacterium pelagium]|uniref:Uncharacterized protein n=1 Tax=Actibacterium pelagium TaxID=2029103 RepID=A0A917AP16_9RHOB|nr:hypothetical protein [Actibacterium pelagium]GGE62847.1 hypothetical protein GCM10011517_33230 [Actibacterium pelagium]
MRFEFSYHREKRALTVRLRAAEYEPVPFVDRLHFWGVDRKPDPQMLGLACCILAAPMPVYSVQLPSVNASSNYCLQIRNHIGVDVHLNKVDDSDRRLLGGDNTVYPYRFVLETSKPVKDQYFEPLSWTGFGDFRGNLGGSIRTNIDAFELTEAEKSLVLALCCAGDRLGYLIVEDLNEELRSLLHNLGLGIVPSHKARLRGNHLSVAS